MNHLTTRPFFVFGLAFGVLFLIPVWGGFGALQQSEAGHAEAGHGGMAMGGMMEAKRAFIGEREAFVVQYTRPDGCVEPPLKAAEHEEGMSAMGSAGEMKPMESMGMGGREEQAGGPRSMTGMEGMEEHEEENPVVYLQALQFGYLPAELCLKSGVAYEFKMMATDVTHGGSIQLGSGSKMVRLPAGAKVEQVVTFTEPGEYLLYCSFYCGVGHPFMRGKIIVEPGPEYETASAEPHGG